MRRMPRRTSIPKGPDYRPLRWRDESSVVTAIKRAYNEASHHQKAQIRAFFRRVEAKECG